MLSFDSPSLWIKGLNEMSVPLNAFLDVFDEASLSKKAPAGACS